MKFRYFFSVLLVLSAITSAFAQTEQTVPSKVYSDIDYILSLTQSSADLDPEKLANIVQFVSSIPTGTGISLKDQQGAAGAFYGFSVHGNITDIFDYVYNPEIPLYITMPSSIRLHEWLTPQTTDALRQLPRLVESPADIRLLRGRDQEMITPDTNTGGYYSYSQDRLLAIFPGPKGPVLISVSSQNDSSDIGKKGCIAGEDNDWNYLYSKETGLNTTGLGWVDSYMYFAHSVLVYAVDSSTGEIHMGSFKWLNAGWASMNMVKSSHILEGIKRFASDFKAVLEAPGLPEAEVLAAKHRELQQTDEQELRNMVSPYLKHLSTNDTSAIDSSFFKKLVSSGDYLQQMSRNELVQILLLEYLKGSIGKKTLLHLASETSAHNPVSRQ